MFPLLICFLGFSFIFPTDYCLILVGGQFQDYCFFVEFPSQFCLLFNSTCGNCRERERKNMI